MNYHRQTILTGDNHTDHISNRQRVFFSDFVRVCSGLRLRQTKKKKIKPDLYLKEHIMLFVFLAYLQRGYHASECGGSIIGICSADQLPWVSMQEPWVNIAGIQT